MKVNLDDARLSFLAFPEKTLREWGEEWNMSHENVRLMKKKLGIATTKKVSYDPMVASEIVEYIRKGKGTINTGRTFENYKFGKVTFINWMERNPLLAEAIQNAENEALENRLYPTHKRCATTGEWLPISEFYQDKNTLDGYSVRSKKVVKDMARKYYYDRNVEQPTVNEKICSGVPELGPLPTEYFARNTRSATGLQTYSKKFQGLYQKYLRQGSDNAFEEAKKNTLDYFESIGFKQID